MLRNGFLALNYISKSPRIMGTCLQKGDTTIQREENKMLY